MDDDFSRLSLDQLGRHRDSMSAVVDTPKSPKKNKVFSAAIKQQYVEAIITAIQDYRASIGAIVAYLPQLMEEAEKFGGGGADKKKDVYQIIDTVAGWAKNKRADEVAWSGNPPLYALVQETLSSLIDTLVAGTKKQLQGINDQYGATSDVLDIENWAASNADAIGILFQAGFTGQAVMDAIVRVMVAVDVVQGWNAENKLENAQRLFAAVLDNGEQRLDVALPEGTKETLLDFAPTAFELICKATNGDYNFGMQTANLADPTDKKGCCTLS